MTVCVAALADDGKTIVYAADKMIGAGFIETEGGQEKILPLGERWRVLVSGDDVAPAFEILDRARHKLMSKPNATYEAASEVMEEAWAEKRLEEAEALYLRPRGMTLDDFKKERLQNPDSASVQDLDSRVSRHEFSLHLLVVGFDNGEGRIFSLYREDRGIAKRHDAPGFHAVGSGWVSAVHMMYLRDLSPVMPARLALYYAYEGKYFGEDAPGVGWQTDLYIWRTGEAPIKISFETVEKILVEKLVVPLGPKSPRQSHVKVLNEIPELKGFERVKREKRDDEWIIVRDPSAP